MIGFPHVPTFHWNVVTPLPDPKEDSVKASDSNPERSRAPPAPAKGLSPLETDREGSGEGDPLRGKGPPKGVQSLLPSVACAGKKPRSQKRSGASHMRRAQNVYSPRAAARGGN